ncbi:DUF6969 family protein [Rhodospirillum centenum]|uniref:DUF6969 domain-containing protein n=1 Tax=Rhodospirillum centenum (strain ATCC 51521 / SW) TaxID=414684 RepID=B6IT80_RHOCS|nr:hypothetical protein [Rhodospirillum centenum]ACI98838.1 conserved hypothetical protein [Rhodospirillum centenum SW]
MGDLDLLTQDELEALTEAAREVALCARVLAKTGDNVISEVLRGAGPFYEWRHYPPSDVYDSEYHAQFYYHAHPPEERVEGEHGHFHTFLRPLGMPEGIRPVALPDLEPDEDGNDALAHLVGISMDRSGRPIRLFTTNRWVTGETWYRAEDVIRMLDGFVVDHARPSWPLNRWITALVRFYRPRITTLLMQRDAAVARWQTDHPDSYVYDDRGLEVPSETAVDLDSDMAAVEAAMRRMRRGLRQAGGRR